MSDEKYQARPVRPFKPRGAEEKQAARARRWYLKNRERILSEEHANYQKAERSPEWQEESHKRRRSAAKRRQKKLGEAERQRQREILASGREKAMAEFEADRLENQWDAIKLRLAGEEHETIRRCFGSFNKINRWFCDADIPEGNPCKYDRAYAFTRGSAISLMVSVGCTSSEFARLLKRRDPKFREQRTTIWFTGREKRLVPWEAELCIGLRKDVAKKLLAEETVRGLSHLDSYERNRVLVTLFPRLKREHKLVLETLPAVRLFLRATAEATEKNVANFIIERARQESRGDLAGRNFRLLLRWLAELMPSIIANVARISGDELLGPVAIDLVAYMCDCSRKIVKSAIYNGARPYDSRRMRELIRNHFSVEPPPAVKVSKAGRTLGKKDPDTVERIPVAAALKRLKVSHYQAAPVLYPLNAKRTRPAAEAAYALFRKRNAKDIDEALEAMDVDRAEKIISAWEQSRP